ncbi:MAG: response regulator [Acidobacteriota bacterium]
MEFNEKLGEIKGGTEKLLIVEDEEALRQLLKETFMVLGYEILQATDGFEAIELFREKADLIDLVILDIGLPGMAGDIVAMKLKSIRPHARIVIASGYLEFPRKAELLELGVKEFIQKPYSIMEIASTVRRILDEAPFSPV